ncbi:DNA polymerase IV [Methylovirgula sp. 4M-Z18]|uniref:DNA polymerase IV n=1 Tax=Methylovirgula sp. 4M-Z18 TaxID=2293567 RepID=UPI000E2F4AAA|nr:DNA polymerase IV [Methylovirgula sp. 4M-Z18]RFB80674.1 DNA polymerase IV [Methylovirgula sp. 4M-Z18]
MGAADPSHLFLCRDCLTDSRAASLTRCPNCGSPRLLSHPERDQLTIAHIDCDAFYATIEKRDNPGLRDKPVIVGGGKRGVVSTCCYIARTYGVRSAMPMFKALQACPQAIVIPPDMAKYARVGREVRRLMLDLTPLVEPLSIDEAFLDLSGTEKLHHGSPAVTLARFAKHVEANIGISISIGLSDCKFLAKIASDIDKPRGFAVIGRAEAPGFLAAQPVGLIWGVGRAMQERLGKDGIRTIADLLPFNETDLFRRYGSEGGRLYRLARGIDKRRVSPERETKSVSAETTFFEDISDGQELRRILFQLSERVAKRLRAQGFSGRTVTLKLKTADFKLRTRARTLPHPTQLAGRIFEAGDALLALETGATRFRLIGIGLSDLGDPALADQGDLVDTNVAREKATESAVNKLREKFGDGAIVKGIVFHGAGPRKNGS